MSSFNEENQMNHNNSTVHHQVIQTQKSLNLKEDLLDELDRELRQLIEEKNQLFMLMCKLRENENRVELLDQLQSVIEMTAKSVEKNAQEDEFLRASRPLIQWFEREWNQSTHSMWSSGISCHSANSSSPIVI